MALARNSTADLAGASTSGGVQTRAFTNTSGDCLVIYVWKQQAASSSDTITYGGDSLTFIGSASEGAGGTLQSYIRYSPKTGANNIVFTLASGDVYVRMIALSYSGSINSGTTPDGHSEITSATSTSRSGTITVTASNAWVTAVAVNRTDISGATGTGVLTNISGVTDTDIALRAFDSNGTVSTGSQTYGYTGGGSGATYMSAVSIAPSTVQNLTLTAVVASFALTGISLSFLIGKLLSAITGTFSLTGINASLSANLQHRLSNVAKPVTGFVNSMKVSIGEVWGTVTSTWSSETRSWMSVSQLFSDTGRPTGSIQNVSKS